MAKYASWADLEREAPEKYQRKATPDAYRQGLQRIAPPGAAVKDSRVRSYQSGVEGKGRVWLTEFREAMFGA